ncbi:hypothetical protein PG988_007188 [Apiospora saccharicola]
MGSNMGSITHVADPASPGGPYYHRSATEYRMSRAGLSMLMVILVLGTEPGFCATNFSGVASSSRDRGAPS